MKYIKLYESLDTYEKISKSKFVDTNISLKMIDITDNEIYQLRGSYNGVRIGCANSWVTSYKNVRVASIRIPIITPDPDKIICIYSLQDEWYFVTLYLTAIDEYIYYKCDQITGLFDCLEYISSKSCF